MNACVAKNKTKSGILYYVVIEEGRDAKGRPIKKWKKGGYDKVSDAKKRVRELASEIDQGDYVKQSGLTVGEYLQDWITSRRASCDPLPRLEAHLGHAGPRCGCQGLGRL